MSKIERMNEQEPAGKGYAIVSRFSTGERRYLPEQAEKRRLN